MVASFGAVIWYLCLLVPLATFLLIQDVNWRDAAWMGGGLVFVGAGVLYIGVGGLMLSSSHSAGLSVVQTGLASCAIAALKPVTDFVDMWQVRVMDWDGVT
jgi:hypothetical protein